MQAMCRAVPGGSTVASPTTTGNCSLAGLDRPDPEHEPTDATHRGLNLIGQPASQLCRRPSCACAAPPARAPVAAGLVRRRDFSATVSYAPAECRRASFAQHWGRSGTGSLPLAFRRWTIGIER